MQRYALALVVACLLTVPVQGAVTATNTFSHVQLDGRVSDPPAFQEFHEYVNRTDNGLFQQSRYDSIQLPTGTASAMASQTSSFGFSGSGDLTGLSFEGTSMVTGVSFGVPVMTMASASSFLGVEFEVTGSPITVTLQGNMARGANRPTIFVDKRLAPTSWQRLLAIEPSSLPPYQSVGFYSAIDLQPGYYALYASVSSLGYMTFADSSSLAFTAELTPEPASLALLALGGLAVLRRRR